MVKARDPDQIAAMKMTDKRQMVLNYIIDCVLSEHQVPSSHSIADHFGFKSHMAGYTYILTLRDMGYLRKNSLGGYMLTEKVGSLRLSKANSLGNFIFGGSNE